MTTRAERLEAALRHLTRDADDYALGRTGFGSLEDRLREARAALASPDAPEPEKGGEPVCPACSGTGQVTLVARGFPLAPPVACPVCAPAPSGAPDHPFVPCSVGADQCHYIPDPCGLPASAHPPADQGERFYHLPRIVVLECGHADGLRVDVMGVVWCPTCGARAMQEAEPPAGEGEARLRDKKLLDSIGRLMLADDEESALALLASEREGLERERDAAFEGEKRAVRRLVEATEPGTIGAFAARDAALARAEGLERALRQIIQGAQSQTAHTGMSWMQVEQIARAALQQADKVGDVANHDKKKEV